MREREERDRREADAYDAEFFDLKAAKEYTKYGEMV